MNTAQKTIIASWQLINIPFAFIVKNLLVHSVKNPNKGKIINKKLVIASNHVFWTDPFITCYSFPLATKLHSVPFSFFIANRFINNLLLRPFAGLFGGFPAKEHPRYGWGMKEARLRLADGPVMIFPEGKFTSYKGQHEPKWGVASLAKDKDVEILPVHIKRAEGKMFRAFSIVYGTPQNMSGKSPQEIMDIIYNL